MKLLSIAVAAFVLCIAPAGAVAGDHPEAVRVAHDLALVSSLDARDELLAAGGAGGGAAADDEHNRPLVAMASLAVPGTGQLMKGHKRGYLFLAAELALWGGFYLLDSKGMDERDDYETFADDHWDFAAYSAWYQSTCVGCEDCDPYLCRPLAEYGTQEYYEDIGKYATYWRWWDIEGDETYVDWDEYSAGDEALRDAYYDMRGDSNRHLRQARYMMMAAFLNHIVAAVDAFLSSGSGMNEHAEGGAILEFDVADGGDGLRCALMTRY
jgi:hypothetical protein